MATKGISNKHKASNKAPKKKIGKKKNSNGFKPGQSGNPKGGIPKFHTFSWLIDKHSISSINHLRDMDLEKIPVKEAIVIKQIIAAFRDDDLKVTEWLANRSEGAPKQTVDMNSEVNNILTFEQAVKAKKKS